MSITLNLPPELAKMLAEQARQRGLSINDHVLNMLGGHNAGKPTAKTGNDLVAYWQTEGLIGTRGDIADSSEHARTLRQQAEARDRG